MDLGISERVQPLLDAVRTFITERVLPVDEEFLAEVGKDGDRWTLTERQAEILDDLKTSAREQGLWNFWLTDSERGYGLTTVEYAYLAEETGRAHLAAEAFNCSAPDTGNMEVLERYGSDAQKAEWLEPLLNGDIRSAYAMTEPGVASSDATNISTSAVLDNGEWLINGEKTYISGAGDPGFGPLGDLYPLTYHQVGVRTDYFFRAAAQLTLNVNFTATYKHYFEHVTFESKNRRDVVLSPGAQAILTGLFNNRADLIVAYRFEYNTSNDGFERYTNHVVGIRMLWRIQ